MGANNRYHPQYGEDDDYKSAYNQREVIKSNIHRKRQHITPSWKKDPPLQREMEEKTKPFFIGEQNWRKILQCWQDFIDQDYEDRSDALFSLVEELIHENDPQSE